MRKKKVIVEETNEKLGSKENKINLDSELKKFLYDYNCDNKHINNVDLRLERITPESWQLRDFDTGNILWEGNSKDAIGGYIGFLMEKLSNMAVSMIDGRTLEVALQRVNNKE